MMNKTKGDYIMEKLTTKELVATFKSYSYTSIQKVVAQFEEELTWEEDDRFIPMYTKEDRKELIAALLILEKEKYEEEQKEWFYHFQRTA
tara:strand:- start:1270 stop:1539 length:270 start_codon:yes stop_codon:yes gene_type:complete